MKTISPKLSENFSQHEFDCHCGGAHPSPMDYSLIVTLQHMRNILGRKVKINRGFSCPYWNEKIGGSETSQHLFGRGVDVHCVDNIYRAELIIAAFKAGFTYVKIYKTHVHLDNRSSKKQKLEFKDYGEK